MVRALELLYEATGGDAWRNNDKWLSGEPCVDGWFGVHCCPQALPVLRGDDECTADGGGAATGVLMTQGSAACHSGSVTGTALDLATCVVVKVLLPSNNLIGQIPPLTQLPYLQHLDLSDNALTGSLPSAADCFPRLTYLDLTQTRSWDNEGGVTGPVPEWLLDRLVDAPLLTTLRLANNAFDDPTDADSAVAIRQLWKRCSTLGAEQCSGVPPIGCSAFNRQGQRYEVELDSLGCVRCPTPLEIAGIGGGIAGVVLLFALLVYAYTRLVRKYPEHAKTHVATIMIFVGHLQTLTIIGSLQLGWPLIIQEILASINLPLMGYIPLPCILTDPVLKALLSYAETAIVLLLLLGAWLVAWRRRKAATRAALKRKEAQSALEAGTVAVANAAKDAARAKAAADKADAAAAEAEYFLCVLFSLLFTVGLRVSASLFMRYDEGQTRLMIARLVASLLPLFWLFLLWRFLRLLREARGTAEKAKAAALAVAAAAASRVGMGEYVLVNGRRGRITTDDGTSNPYKVTFDNGEVSGWLYPHDVARDVTRAMKALPQSEAARKARADAVQLQKEERRAAEAVRYLTERYASDDPGGARWPLRSQWQLVVWTRQGLLFLVSFAMDCVVWFAPYEEHQTARYVFAGLAIAVLGGLWLLQARRLPYAMRQQHWLETFLYAVDILVIVGACVYGALTHYSAVQDGFMRRALELGLGALLGASVLVAALVIGIDILLERNLIQNWYQTEGLVQALEGRKKAADVIDTPIVAAIRDGAVRLIDCAWLLDSARSDGQLPRVTKVVARLVSDEPRSVLIRRLATHCGTSSICITVEAASAASSVRPWWRWRLWTPLSEASGRQGRWWRRWWWSGQPTPPLSPPPSPPEVAARAEVQLEDRSSARHVTRLGHELAETGLQRRCNTKHADAKLMRSLTSSPARSPGSGTSGRFHSRRGRDSFAEDLTMEAASKSEHPSGRMTRRGLPTPSSFPRPGAVGSGRMDHNHGIVLQDLDSRPAHRKNPALVVTFHLSTFDEVAPLTAARLQGKAEAVKERLAELGAKDIEIVTGKPFLPRCQDMPAEAFLSPERAVDLFERRRRGVKVVSYCWRMPGMPDPDGLTLEKIRGYLHVIMGGIHGEYGLFVDVACMPQNFAWPSWHAPEAFGRFGAEVSQGPLTILKFDCERVATEDEAQVCVDKLVALCDEKKWALASMADFKSLGLPRGHVSVLFHGRYKSGAYSFDVPTDKGTSAGGYMRFSTPADAKAARQDPKLKRLCGGKEPKLMGEHVFENELKFGRALSVMGSLYASATGTCVLQLTDPPGELGKEVAPDELVSARTGTVFVVRTNMSLEELREELGDDLLACEKKGWGEAVVRVLGERAARAAHSLNERGYPLRRKDRVVYPMYSLRPYGSRGWPTFETSAASMVLAHLTQRKRRGGALPPLIAQAEASSLKFINIDVIDKPRELEVAQTPERLLRQCKKKLRSKKTFFTGKADQKVVIQLLCDFEDSIAVEFDQKRASHLKLRTEDLVCARAAELGDARKKRYRKMLQRLTFYEEPTPILHESEPTHIIHAVPSAISAAPSPQARSPPPPLHLQAAPDHANEYRRAPGKPPCRYGTACYREEPHHFRHFDHPSDHPLIARGFDA